MEILAAIAVPIWIFLLPLIMLIPLVAPRLVIEGRGWAHFGAASLMLPFTGALWWIPFAD
jgi:hypothetical protein